MAIYGHVWQFATMNNAFCECERDLKIQVYLTIQVWYYI